MKLGAKARLLSAFNGAVRQFYERIAKQVAGTAAPSGRTDCRATVGQAIKDRKVQPNDLIVVVGDNDDGVLHAVHTFVTSPQHKILADARTDGQWDGETYTSGLGGGSSLTRLGSMTISAFESQYVHAALLASFDPSTAHGHVVPRPDGLRAKCGGLRSVLGCTICAREEQLLAAGAHPLNLNPKEPT